MEVAEAVAMAEVAAAAVAAAAALEAASVGAAAAVAAALGAAAGTAGAGAVAGVDMGAVAAMAAAAPQSTLPSLPAWGPLHPSMGSTGVHPALPSTQPSTCFAVLKAPTCGSINDSCAWCPSVLC